MDTKNEWQIIINRAQRRIDTNKDTLEDHTILEINQVLEFLLGQVYVGNDGEISIEEGKSADSLKNILNLFYSEFRAQIHVGGMEKNREGLEVLGR